MGRAQMEMIGLAFVVVLIVIGIMLALVFQAVGSERIPASLIKERNAFGTALETAMLETTVDECGYPLAIAIRNCMKGGAGYCGNKNVCESTHDAMNEMLSAMIGPRMAYNATLEQDGSIIEEAGNTFLFPPYPEYGCESIIARPSQSIHIGPGVVEFSIAFCE